MKRGIRPPFPLPTRIVLAALALCAASCSDHQVAGTSSGVDNPSLTVSFAGASGAVERVSGDLDVYGADQNPAFDPEPLATIRVRNSSLTEVTGADFARASQALSKRTSARRAASSAPGADGFNLVFRTLDGFGALGQGLAWDSAAGAFRRGDSTVKSLTLRPEPLLRYAGRVAKDSVHGSDCRVFAPGTPFLAVLVDSEFVFEALPPGRLPMRLIGGDGSIYPMDTLDTRDMDRVFHPSPVPLGAIDTAAPPDTVPDFAIAAPEPHETYAEFPDNLEATVSGISPDDPRLSILWKFLPDTAASSDTANGRGFRPPPAILAPTSLRTEVRYRGDGVYRFQVSAAAGARIRFDTALVSVRHLPPPPPMVVHPAPAESLFLGRPYMVQWMMPGKGPYFLDLSLDNGATWIPLAIHYLSPNGLQLFPWTPPSSLPPSDSCLLRVGDESDSTLRAATPAVFILAR